MRVIWILSAALVFFAAWFMKVRIKGHSKTDVALKLVCSVCLVTIAAKALLINTLLRETFSAPGLLLLIGGLLGAVGDLFLGLSHLNKEKKRKNMLLGIIGFGMGHVVYCSAVILKYSDCTSGRVFVIPFVGAVALAAFMGICGRRLGLHFGRYLPVVVTYVLLLSFSVFLSIGLNVALGWENRQLNIFGLGMLLFIISDSILSGMYFGKTGNSPKAVVSNHVTYYLAQWLIAFSILFM